nr:Spt6 [Cucujiformia]
DGSRVHPETYEWAKKMAADALEYENDNENSALEKICDYPERLRDLDLDAFAAELDRQGLGYKDVTLRDIREELCHSYKDSRSPFRSANAEELFVVLTKETSETFYIGKMITAQVVAVAHKKPQPEQLNKSNPMRKEETGLWQCPLCLKDDFPEFADVWNHFDAGDCPGQVTGIKLYLDNGISGFIYTKNISDEYVANPKDVIRTNQLIQCRIMKIDIEKFNVICTSKSSDLNDAKHEWRSTRDLYYNQEKENEDLRIEEKQKVQKQRKPCITRCIAHPSFRNVSFMEAEKYLANVNQGEAIIRPSSKGTDHLSVTWKVTDGIYQHIDVRE